MVKIDEIACKGCNLCVHACPKKVLSLDGARVNAKGYNPAIVTDEEKCILCAMCGIVCPDSAIVIKK